MNKFTDIIENRGRCHDLIIAGTVPERRDEVRRLLQKHPASDVKQEPGVLGTVHEDGEIQIDLAKIQAHSAEPSFVAEIYFHELAHVLLQRQGIHGHCPEFAAEALALTRRMCNRQLSAAYQNYNLTADGHKPTNADISAIKQRAHIVAQQTTYDPDATARARQRLEEKDETDAAWVILLVSAALITAMLALMYLITKQPLLAHQIVDLLSNAYVQYGVGLVSSAGLIWIALRS